MKKSIAVFAVLCLLFCLLIGCTAESPETTTTTPSTTTTTPATPVQDDDGVCGVDGNWYFSSDWCDHYSIDSCISDLVDQEVVSAWGNQFVAMNPETGIRGNSELNCCVFIREMKIPREDVENVCEWYESIFPGQELYSDSQIDAIYNGTEEDIVREFASPYAIVIGTKIYSPKWLYEHTVEEYVTEGITFELFNSKLPQIIIPCDTEDKWTTILARYDEFRRLQEPAYAGRMIDADTKVTVSGKNYSAQWFAEHTAEDYREAGISYDLLSENIVGILIRCRGDDRLYVYDRYTALKALETAVNDTAE